MIAHKMLLAAALVAGMLSALCTESARAGPMVKKTCAANACKDVGCNKNCTAAENGHLCNTTFVSGNNSAGCAVDPVLNNCKMLTTEHDCYTTFDCACLPDTTWGGFSCQKSGGPNPEFIKINDCTNN